MLRRSALYLLTGVALLGVPNNGRAGPSNSLMDVSPDGAWLLVANPDNGTVTIVDVVARKAVHEIKVGDKPEGVCWIGNGPRAAATVYHEDLVVFFDTRNGKIIKKLTVPDEPYGIVANKAGTKAWVTHEYPGLVSEIDLQDLNITSSITVGPRVRGLALNPDESRLYVTEFYTAILHAVDLRPDGPLTLPSPPSPGGEGRVGLMPPSPPSPGGEGRVRGRAVVDSWQGHAVDNLCRHVVVHPRRPKAYLSHIRSKVERNTGNGAIFPHLSVCDLVPPNGSKRRTSIALDSYNNVRVVTNPWEAALSPDGNRLYTIYAGTNDMNVSKVVDDDYQEIERQGNAVNVGKNPRAVRVSPDGKTVFVYNPLDFAVSFHEADSLRRRDTVQVCAPPKTPEWVRGKVLFNTALPPMTSRLWIACSSCHPDGHTDGRVWQNPEGLRKTTALFGMAHTHPLHWSADRDEVQDFEYTIRSQLMRGRGLLEGPIKPKQEFVKTELEESLAGRSKDLDALAIYCNSFEFTLSPHILAPGKLSAAAERGQRLYFSKEVGCANCHSGPYYTDSSLQKPFKLHDVGTGTDDATEKMGPAYDTPTLLGVYRTPPYLHHGKAKTLHDVLTSCNKNDRHGRTSHLKKQEIDDLVEFLKSLPYEKPPDETPNTVTYRLPAKKADGHKEADKADVKK